jgi:hypothetical protein
MTEEMAEHRTPLRPPIKGVVTARPCEHCGHHEMGVVTDEGHFIALRPGLIVEIKGEKQHPGLRDETS